MSTRSTLDRRLTRDLHATRKRYRHAATHTKTRGSLGRSTRACRPRWRNWNAVAFKARRLWSRTRSSMYPRTEIAYFTAAKWHVCEAPAKMAKASCQIAGARRTCSRRPEGCAASASRRPEMPAGRMWSTSSCPGACRKEVPSGSWRSGWKEAFGSPWRACRRSSTSWWGKGPSHANCCCARS